jgi:hypothetical protein
MHRHGTVMEMGVKIYATNVANKPDPQIPMYSNKWRISETNFVPAANTMYGVNMIRSRLNTETCDESFTLY